MASTTLTQFRTEIGAIVGVDNSAAGDQPLVDKWVNEGYEDFVRRTECNILWADMALTADEDTYTLPPQIMTIKEIVNADSTSAFPFERTTLAEIINYRRAQSAAPARYYAVQGTNMLVVYPVPGADETVTVWYVPRPSPLSVGSDTPDDVPAEFHQAIQFYALSRVGEFDQSESSQFGSFWLGRYEQMVHECRKSVRQHGGQRSATVKLGRRDKVSLLSDPSRIRW